jgi:hypothetical protein
MPSQLARSVGKHWFRWLVFPGSIFALLFPSDPALAATATLSPGLQIAVRMDTAISTKDRLHYFGPIIEGTLDQDVVTGDGRIAIPAGSTVKLAMSDFHRAGHVSGRARLRLRLYSVVLRDGSEVPLDGYVATLDDKQKPDKEGTLHGKHGLVKDAGFDLAAIATGVGVGLAVGGPYGLPAGAAGGLLAAGLWTVIRRGPDLVIPAGSVLSFTLGRPASVRVADRPVADRAVEDAVATASMGSPCAAWGCDSVIPPSRDLLDMLDSPGDPQTALQQLEHVSFRNRPDTDRVFVAYLRGVNELRLSHPQKAVGDLKAAYTGAKSLNLPPSAQSEIARNLVLALKEGSKEWEQNPLMRDPGLQAALVQPVGGRP